MRASYSGITRPFQGRDRGSTPLARSMAIFEDFKNLDIRIGKILTAERVEGTDKLIKLEIDFTTETRQILSAIAEFFEPEYLVGKEVPVLLNIEPRKFKGLLSQGMILAADDEGTPVLLHPEKEIPPGSIVK